MSAQDTWRHPTTTANLAAQNIRTSLSVAIPIVVGQCFVWMPVPSNCWHWSSVPPQPWPCLQEIIHIQAACNLYVHCWAGGLKQAGSRSIPAQWRNDLSNFPPYHVSHHRLSTILHQNTKTWGDSPNHTQESQFHPLLQQLHRGFGWCACASQGTWGYGTILP